MGVMIKWNGKTLEVSANRVNPAEDISYSRALQSDNKADSEGKSTKNLRGYEPRKFSCSCRLTATMGFPDVLGEYQSWEALVGKSAALYIGTVQLTNNPFMLNDVALSDVEQNHVRGTILSAVVKLNFEEVTENKSSKKEKVSNKKSMAKAVSNKSSQKTSAKNIKASSYDKATRK